MNKKGYVSRWKTPEDKERRHLVDYWFTSNPDGAATWESKEQADIDCRMFDRQNIQIPSALGGHHICSGFESEERQGKFVVFCEAPFILAQMSASA